jgi:glycosyltransferase involved in cell wall biosynthesis
MVLLTIAIPTYNRADHLACLLDTLLVELSGLEEFVNIVISDNASTDHTPAVIKQFSSSWTGLCVIRHSSNIGMDGNFRACAEAVDGLFFWFVGDDDLPARGVVSFVIDLLKSFNPDLMYLSSCWMRNNHLVRREPLMGPLKYQILSRESFARRVHVWTTFLSGMVVRRSDVLSCCSALNALSGTHLTQMSWVLERLRLGSRFIYIDTICVLANAGNSGAYSAVKVFGHHFPHIVRASLSDNASQVRIADKIIFRTLLCYLPGLVWSLRLGRLGNFSSEIVQDAMHPLLRAHPLTKLVLIPVANFPKPAAFLLLKLASICANFLVLIDKVR